MTGASLRPLLRRPLLLAPTALLAVAGVTVSTPATAAPPQLSVGLDDGRAQTQEGGTSRYVVTVANLGGKTVHGLHVTQTVPPGATVGSVDGGGTNRKGTLRWSVDVPAGGSVTLRSTLRVDDELPADLLRLATVACVSISATAPPSVCAADSDQLPAGAVAEQRQAPPETTDTRAPTGLSWPSVAGGAGLLVLAGVGLVVVVRRRSRGRRSASSAVP